jgi:23S rRNA pseudouridine1911/1915/1917 synthase
VGVSVQRVNCIDSGRPERVLAQQLGLSRRVVVAWLHEKRIRSVAGETLRKGDRVESGQALELRLEGVLGDWIRPALSPLPALAHGDGWVAINKPAGLPSHLSMPFEDQTALNHLVALHVGTATAGDDPLQGGLVHRLDNDASGTLLAATSTKRFQLLRRAFSEARVRRVYRARVSGAAGALPSGAGEIVEPLLAKGAKVVVDASGRATQTLWRCLDDQGLVELELKTGHRHQIRVHLASQGWPIVGDSLYGGASASRLALHCVELGWGDERVVSPVPEFLQPVVS